MSKWTPGPWAIYDQSEDEGPEFGCSIESAVDKEADWIAERIYNRADARLIAAAPEMIDELKALCLYFGCVGVEAGYTEQEDEPCGQCRTCLAQKVIEKAEGA